MPDDLKLLDPLPVEAKPPDTADALEDSLLPALTRGPEESIEASETARELAQLISRNHSEALEDRTEWEMRLDEWEDAYYGRLPEKSFPWPGAANFHVPLTMMGVETYKPRLIEAVLGNEPPIQVVPVESTDEVRRDRVELFLNWQARVEIDIAPIVAETAHLFLIPGTVVSKQTWEVQRRTRSYVREFPLTSSLQDIMSSLFGEKPPRDLEQIAAMEWKGEIKASERVGGDLTVRFKLKFLEDQIQVRVIEEYLRERPVPTPIDPPDFITPVKGGSDVQALPWCQHRLWMSEAELRAQARQGRFDARLVEKLLERGGRPSGDRNQLDATAYREGRAATEGVEDQGVSNVRKNQYEILEDYRFYDINDDGEQEHIISWFCKDFPDHLLGWDLVDNVYAHGKRPFAVGRPFPIPFAFYGLSFAEIIKGIQDEADTIHNQRTDYGTIQNLPFFFYRASSTLAPFPARLRPGEGVPVDNPSQDINFPKWQGNTAWGQQEEALLLQYYERLTGLTDLTLGRQPTRVGATRTAAGTSTLLSEAGLRQKTVLESFQRFWIEIFEQLLALDQEYLPPGKEFRVTGRYPEFIRLKDRNEIQGRYDIRLSSTSQNMNKVVAREDAGVLLQAALNPAALQTGIIGVKGVQRCFADLFRAYGKDPDSYLEMHGVPLSPEEELRILVSGGTVKAVMGIDIAAHLQAHQQQLQSPVIRSVLMPEGVQKLQRLIMEETQLAQAQQLAQSLQQQGKGQPNGGRPGPQQAQAQQGRAAPQPNAQTSLSPTPVPNGGMSAQR